MEIPATFVARPTHPIMTTNSGSDTSEKPKSEKEHLARMARFSRRQLTFNMNEALDGVDDDRDR